MKRVWKLLPLIALIVALLCFVVACGGETPENPDPGKVNPGDTPTQNFGTVNVSGINFKRGNGFSWKKNDNALTLPWDGLPHKLSSENFSGDPDPRRAAPQYDYYLNGTLIASYDENGDQIAGDAKYANGITDAGTYQVKVLFKSPNYTAGVKEVNMVIAESITINYQIGQPSDLSESLLQLNNQTVYQYTTELSEILLFEPTINSTTIGYKFRGWYLDEACETTKLGDKFKGSDFTAEQTPNKTLTLYAKFNVCVEYPPIFTDNTIENPVTSAPATLPAIPGFDQLPEDKATLIDMSLLSEIPTNMGYGYSSHGREAPNETNPNAYYLTLATSFLTEGGAGQYALQWQDPCDRWNFRIDETLEGAEAEEGRNNHVAGDKLYGALMSFTSPLKNFNYGNYNTLEFWIYNANAGDRIITMVAFPDNNNSSNMYYDIKLDFSGWKKFTLHVNDFETVTGATTTNITMLNFYGTDFGGGIPSQNANLAESDKDEFVFFSSIYLTNRNTAYDLDVNLSGAGLNAVLEKIMAGGVKASVSDEELGYAFSDIATSGLTQYMIDMYSGLSDSYSISEAYKLLFQMSEAWNDPNSVYYHDAEVLTTIADGMNFLTAGAYELVNTKVPTDGYFEQAAYYIVKITAGVAEYVNTKHAEAWMTPVLHFVQGPSGTGNFLMRTAYTYAVANIARGNVRGFMEGFRAMASALSTNRITLSKDTADIVDFMQLVAAVKDTPMMSRHMTEFLDEVYNWFYYSIDSFLINGTVPTEMTYRSGYISLDTYLRGMMLIYDISTSAQQNKFAAAMKYYMAQDTGLEARLNAAVYYNREATALTAIKANAATAASPTTDTVVIRTWDAIGQVYYRNGSEYLVFDNDGYKVNSSGFTLGNFTTLNCDRLYTLVCGNIVAVVPSVSGTIYFIDETGVTVEYAESAFYTDGKTSIAVSTIKNIEGDNVLFSSEASGAVSSVAPNVPVMIGTAVDTDGNLTIIMNNYTEARENISFTIRGSYEPVENNDPYTATVDGGRTNVTVTTGYDPDATHKVLAIKDNMIVIELSAQ